MIKMFCLSLYRTTLIMDFEVVSTAKNELDDDVDASEDAVFNATKAQITQSDVSMDSQCTAVSEQDNYQRMSEKFTSIPFGMQAKTVFEHRPKGADIMGCE
jgi:hypothetical protein